MAARPGAPVKFPEGLVTTSVRVSAPVFDLIRNLRTHTGECWSDYVRRALTNQARSDGLKVLHHNDQPGLPAHAPLPKPNG